jgi:hypothetical protein
VAVHIHLWNSDLWNCVGQYVGTTLSEGHITSLFGMKVGNSKSLCNIDDCLPKCV